MARYRSKDSVDLKWNSVRRRITRELDIQIADWREEALDKLLTHAFEQHVAALQSGEVLELEADYKQWVSKALDENIGVAVEGAAALAQ